MTDGEIRAGRHAAAPDDAHLALPIVLLGPVVFWDMYIGGVRPFDLMAVAAIVIASLAQIRRPLQISALLPFALLMLCVVGLCVRGVLENADAEKTVAGVLVGVITAFFVAAARWDNTKVINGLGIAILVLATLLLLQFVVFYMSGRIINFHGWLGLTPRLESLIFRPAGLFQEPAHYCLMMFGLLNLYRLVGGQNWKIEAFGLATMAVSLSLWGLATVAIYLLMYRPRVAMLLGALGVMAGVLGLSLFGRESTIALAVVDRLANLGSDGSTRSRYSGLFNGDLLASELWFGHGVSSDYLQTGSSSLSFLIAAAGIAGLLALALFWLMASPPTRRIRGGVALMVMLTAASQWTAVWWWVWISLMIVVPSSMQRRGDGAPLAFDGDGR